MYLIKNYYEFQDNVSKALNHAWGSSEMAPLSLDRSQSPEVSSMKTFSAENKH